MAYVRGKGELVGVFSFDEIRKGEYVPALERMKEKTGLKNSYPELFLENCVPTGLEMFVCAEIDKR